MPRRHAKLYRRFGEDYDFMFFETDKP